MESSSGVNEILIARIKRLERANQRFKIVGFVVVAAIVAMGAGKSHPHFDVLTASQINVVDANGNLRIALGSDSATGAGGITVFQTDGIPRVALGIAADDTAGFSANSDNGTTRVAAASSTSGQGGVFAFDVNGHLRAEIFSNPTLSGFDMRQASGAVAGNLTTSDDGRSQGLGIDGLNGNLRVGLGSEDPSEGTPFEFVNINAPDGTERVASGADGDASDGLIQTFRSDGTVSGHLP